MKPIVLSAQLSHETNTFSRTRTTLESFRQRILLEDDEVARNLANTRCEIAAHIAAAAQYGWRLLQPIAAHATPSGRATAATWAYLLGRVLVPCRHPIDGVILALHGAMAVEGEDDAEGALLADLRRRLGPRIPIAITLDLHANVTDRMAENCNLLFAYRTYPHIDQRDVAAEAAAQLDHLMRSGEHSRCVVVRGPMLDGCDHGRTHERGVMTDLLALAAAQAGQRGKDEIVNVAVCAGFPWADIAQAGPSITACGTANPGDLRAAATAVLEVAWARRGESSLVLLPVAEVVRKVQAHPSGLDPIVVADFTDNPGHGAPGDGVRLLAAVVDAALTGVAFAGICDPESVRQCESTGEGRLSNFIWVQKSIRASMALRCTSRRRCCDCPMGTMCAMDRCGPASASTPGRRRSSTCMATA